MMSTGGFRGGAEGKFAPPPSKKNKTKKTINTKKINGEERKQRERE